MLRDQIKKDIEKQVSRMVGEWAIGSEAQARRDGGEVTRTSDARFGDYTSNVALKIAQNAKRLTTNARKSYQSPIEFARVLADSLRDLPYVEKLEVAPPGFLNFFIKPEVWQKQVEDVLNLGEKYGSNQVGKDKKARIEFVSANPTGPLHFGNARGGPIGDVLANVLEFCGFQVLREYLHNDIGGQVDKLGQSVLNVAKGEKLQDQEYKGEYVRELADRIFAGPVSSFPPASARSGKKTNRGQKSGVELRAVGSPSSAATPKNFNASEVGKAAVDILFEEIKEDCRAMGITFDEFYSESEFINSGETKQDIDHLREKGVLKEKDGALWFAPSDEFLKDRETVVVKSDGSFTYFANDIAYHDLKFKDNPDLVIDVFGANHHGHVPRLQAVIKELGYDVSRFHVILYQWVRFKRGGELVAMSKRSGTFVTAREVLDEVGRDALRFFILMYDPNSHIDFDLELAKEKSKENPVYYVQYAHARIASILRRASSKFNPSASLRARVQSSKLANYELLTTNYELDLIKQISKLPELVEDIAQNFAVHRLTAYATDLADSFHKFYENCRVIPASPDERASRGGGEKEDLMKARIGLIMATKIVLTNTLKLLGISAPEKM
jgi:arginyl-tRNA synthetase